MERAAAMKTNKFEVLVANIGTVHNSFDEGVAYKIYMEYVSQSKAGFGRAANESVILFRNEEIYREHESAYQE